MQLTGMRVDSFQRLRERRLSVGLGPALGRFAPPVGAGGPPVGVPLWRELFPESAREPCSRDKLAPTAERGCLAPALGTPVRREPFGTTATVISSRS